MLCVVFLRAANVGGHQTFQPSKLSKAMEHFGLVNIGAAGTFVIRKSTSRASLRAEFIKRLPFEPEMMIRSARDLTELSKYSWPKDSVNENITRYVSILAKRPVKLPKLPITQPAGDKWEVKVISIVGCFALCLHRKGGPRGIYPNPVVEKQFGLPATTRNWNTIQSICDILNGTA